MLDFYGTDFDKTLLHTHLEILGQIFPQDRGVSVKQFLKFFRTSPTHQLALMEQAGLLVKLLLVMPATNAVSERAFSAVGRIKSFLRLTMTEQRLNNLMVLHVHERCTDNLSLVDVANDFIAGNEHRQQVFGTKFLPADCSSA